MTLDIKKVSERLLCAMRDEPLVAMLNVKKNGDRSTHSGGYCILINKEPKARQLAKNIYIL